jgi:hypothetical protein
VKARHGRNIRNLRPVRVPASPGDRERICITLRFERGDFGLLVNHGPAGSVARHIPFLVDVTDQ